MSITRISVILASVAIVSNSVHCTPTCDVPETNAAGPTTPLPANLPVPSAHGTLSAELLEVLKNYHSSLPGAGQKTPTSPPISIMHFPSAPALESTNGATPSAMVPGVLHQRPFSPDMRIPNRGYNLQTAEPSAPLMQSARGLAENPVSVPQPPPNAETGYPSAHAPAPDQLQSSSVAFPPTPSQVKTGSSGHNNFNQELIKLLADMRMTPVSPQPPAPPAQGHNQMLANGPTNIHPAQTLPILSPGASSSLQPPQVAPPILGPNQTPLDYLLSSSTPTHQLNSIPGYSQPSANTNTWPKAKSRVNYEFIKYLLKLPMYHQALCDLVKAQSSIQT